MDSNVKISYCNPQFIVKWLSDVDNAQYTYYKSMIVNKYVMYGSHMSYGATYIIQDNMEAIWSHLNEVWTHPVQIYNICSFIWYAFFNHIMLFVFISWQWIIMVLIVMSEDTRDSKIVKINGTNLQSS